MKSKEHDEPDNWRTYRIQTISHPRFAGRTLGELSPLELRVLRDTWLKLEWVKTLKMANSSQTVPRHLDVLNITEAVKNIPSIEIEAAKEIRRWLDDVPLKSSTSI